MDFRIHGSDQQISHHYAAWAADTQCVTIEIGSGNPPLFIYKESAYNTTAVPFNLNPEWPGSQGTKAPSLTSCSTPLLSQP